MNKDRIIYRNGLITGSDPAQSEVADLVIEDGVIAEVGRDITGHFDGEVDMTGRRLIPACIDPHVHFALPVGQRITVDDFLSGSRKAMAGGIATVIDFTTPEPGLTLQDSLRNRVKEARQAECTVLLHSTVVGWDADIQGQADKCLEMGIGSFKFFTTYEESGRRTSYEQLLKAAEWAAASGARLIVHAEDQDSLIPAEKLPSDSFRFYESSRPVESEVKAIEKLASIQNETGANIAIVHVSSGSGVKAAINSGLKLETCPQYLTMTRDVFAGAGGWRYAVAPPLRSAAEQVNLWQAVVEGQIHWIGSDHAPFPVEDYDAAGDHFTKTPYGLDGVGTVLSRMIEHGVKTGRITWDQLVSLTSTGAAKFYGIYPEWGSLSVGSRGEFVVIDETSGSIELV